MLLIAFIRFQSMKLKNSIKKRDISEKKAMHFLQYINKEDQKKLQSLTLSENLKD